jgi:glycerophosphoryl diester phosphodiesterase
VGPGHLLDAREPGRPLVVAHRGASATCTENTLPAFRAARDLGADWVELDVHLLADGNLAVHHDGLLHDGRPLAALAAVDLPAHVPLLPSALDACAGMGVNVEVKGDGGTARAAAAAVVEVVDRLGAADRVLVSSFDWSAVDRVRALAPDLPTALLAFVVADRAALIGAAVERGCAAVHPHAGLVDGAFAAAAHEAGLAVIVWTVDDPVHMAELVAAGVDGIVTNVPDVARRVVDGGPVAQARA